MVLRLIEALIAVDERRCNAQKVALFKLDFERKPEAFFILYF